MRDVAYESDKFNAEKFINYGIKISLADSKLGLCTNMHENVAYQKGYAHNDAVLLAHIAARLVDSTKHGSCRTNYL